MSSLGDPEFHFWLRHARRAQEPVVALNAGHSQIARSLAEQGISVLAIAPDLPPDAGGAEGEGLRWRRGEPHTFELTRKAGMVFLAGRSFERLLDVPAQQAALRHIHSNLQVGGKLAFDLSLPPLTLQLPGAGAPVRALPPEETGDGRILYRWVVEHYDWIGQRVSRHITYEEAAPDKSAQRRWHEREERAFFWPIGVRLLLEATGFEVEAVYGGWSDEPLDDSAPFQLWVARKGI